MFPKNVKLVDVGPRIGLQNERLRIETDSKAELIDRLTRAKLSAVECTSLISSSVSPQFHDAKQIGKRIRRRPGTKYFVLFQLESQ